MLTGLVVVWVVTRFWMVTVFVVAWWVWLGVWVGIGGFNTLGFRFIWVFFFAGRFLGGTAGVVMLFGMGLVFWVVVVSGLMVVGGWHSKSSCPVRFIPGLVVLDLEFTSFGLLNISIISF